LLPGWTTENVWPEASRMLPMSPAATPVALNENTLFRAYVVPPDDLIEVNDPRQAALQVEAERIVEPHSAARRGRADVPSLASGTGEVHRVSRRIAVAHRWQVVRVSRFF